MGGFFFGGGGVVFALFVLLWGFLFCFVFVFVCFLFLFFVCFCLVGFFGGWGFFFFKKGQRFV